MANKSSAYNSPVCLDVQPVILNGQTQSGNPVAGTPSDLGGAQLVGLVVPTGFVGTSITFLVSTDGSVANSLPLYKDDGTQYTVTVAAGRYVRLVPADFAGIRYLVLVAGSAQTQNVTLILATRPV